jgi:hypothetical protein
MILMVLDATKRAEQRALLEAELEAVGIRLNREPPYVNRPDATAALAPCPLYFHRSPFALFHFRDARMTLSLYFFCPNPRALWEPLHFPVVVCGFPY